MALNIANDVLDLAWGIASNLRNSVDIVGALRTTAMAGPMVVNDALRVQETLTSTLRYIDGKILLPGLAAAFGLRFGVTPVFPADWDPIKSSGRTLANGLYNVLPKAADGTVQIYTEPDVVTGERTFLSVTLTTQQRNQFTNLYNAFVATMVLS